MNCVDRVLLRSVKPALHANVDCTPLVAAIVSRQAPVVKYLLEVLFFFQLFLMINPHLGIVLHL